MSTISILKRSFAIIKERPKSFWTILAVTFITRNIPILNFLLPILVVVNVMDSEDGTKESDEAPEPPKNESGVDAKALKSILKFVAVILVAALSFCCLQVIGISNYLSSWMQQGENVFLGSINNASIVNNTDIGGIALTIPALIANPHSAINAIVFTVDYLLGIVIVLFTFTLLSSKSTLSKSLAKAWLLSRGKWLKVIGNVILRVILYAPFIFLYTLLALVISFCISPDISNTIPFVDDYNFILIKAAIVMKYTFLQNFLTENETLVLVVRVIVGTLSLGLVAVLSLIPIRLTSFCNYAILLDGAGVLSAFKVSYRKTRPVLSTLFILYCLMILFILAITMIPKSTGGVYTLCSLYYIICETAFALLYIQRPQDPWKTKSLPSTTITSS